MGGRVRVAGEYFSNESNNEAGPETNGYAAEDKPPTAIIGYTKGINFELIWENEDHWDKGCGHEHCRCNELDPDGLLYIIQGHFCEVGGVEGSQEGGNYTDGRDHQGEIDGVLIIDQLRLAGKDKGGTIRLNEGTE